MNRQLVMHQENDVRGNLTLPTPEAAEDALATAQQVYTRTLSNWASTLLSVRAEQRADCRWRAGHDQGWWNRAA